MKPLIDKQELTAIEKEIDRKLKSIKDKFPIYYKYGSEVRALKSLKQFINKLK
jgi:hypothetical protein